jgi:hypothetical protein
MWPASYAGITVQEAMYDYDKSAAAFRKFILDFEPDTHMGNAQFGPGKFYEILDYKLYSWPGHGVAPENSYQCNEDEYMTADEYDALIDDPSGFFQRHLPRVFERCSLPDAPFSLASSKYTVLRSTSPYGLPVQGALHLLEAKS